MKRILIIFLLGIFSVSVLNAEPVSAPTAKKLAEGFVSVYNPGSDIGDIITYRLDNGKVAYYIVKLIPTGWIIVSGDNVLKPVIGYSFKNQFVPKEQWEESAKVWFDKLNTHIASSIEKPELEVNTTWSEILNGSYRKSVTGKAVDPFIEVKWNQSSGWNRFCPEDEKGPGGHAYAGCVAVCAAQAMSVYNYPVQPKGEHNYSHDKYGYISVNYDNQAPYDWDNMGLSSSDDENARLLYHLAVAVNMDFGPDGSGAYTSTLASVLKSYFGYSQSVSYKSRSSYNDNDWKKLIIDELTQNRPVIYSGDGDNGEAGHAFDIDGVGADGTYFHLNWGWSGIANGYYTIDALTPNNYDFSYNQAAIIGIKPPSAGPYDITLSDESVYDQQPPGTFVSKINVADEFQDNSYTYVLKGGFNVLLDDYGPANFYIENDSLKTSKIFNADDKVLEPLRIEVTDVNGSYTWKDFEIKIEKYYFGPTSLSLSDSLVEEGKDPGYFVGLLQIEDDIEENKYSFSSIGGYSPDNLNDKNCFVVRNDSLFTNKTLYKSNGLTYYLELTVSDDKNHEFKRVIEVGIIDNASGGTGVTKEVSDTGLKIYPNPASSYFTIEFDEVTNQAVKASVFNITGQKVSEFPVNSGQTIDISQLKKGIYFIILNSGNLQRVRKITVY